MRLISVDFGFHPQHGLGRRVGVPEGIDLEGHERQVLGMRGPVAQVRRAEVAPRPPRQPLGMEGAKAGRTQPQVPLQIRRHRRLALRVFLVIGPALVVPRVDFLDRAERPVADQLQGPAERVAGRALVAHRGGHLVLPGQLAEHARLVDRARQRLLGIHVLAGADGGGRGHRMDVVGRGHHDGVDLRAHLVDHPPEVMELLGRGDHLVSLGRALVVDVAHGDDVLGLGEAAEQLAAAPAHADHGEVELGVGRRARTEPLLRRIVSPAAPAAAQPRKLRR